MNKPLTPKQTVFILALLLAVAMAITRYHHFGSVVNLPDATLAVFFLAGFYLASSRFFPSLLIEAGVIDYFAITAGETSDWCISPAYVFLIPTYGCLWYAGRWYRRRYEMDWRALAPLFSAVFIGTSAAFLISNGSFYRLSGYFADMSWLEYGASVAPYYLPYMINTLVYIACTAGVHIIVTRLNSWQKNTGLRA